ncbi:MAG TPA: hypothetical protein VD999_04020 [Vitreimonas sp.]|nr:hypothetical protein [Vitreimonas sp.]
MAFENRGRFLQEFGPQVVMYTSGGEPVELQYHRDLATRDFTVISLWSLLSAYGQSVVAMKEIDTTELEEPEHFDLLYEELIREIENYFELITEMPEYEGVAYPRMYQLAHGGGLPYLLMEVFATTFDKKYKLNYIPRIIPATGALLQKRLTTFIRLCWAIDIFHRHGYVLDDIKPSNAAIQNSPEKNVYPFDFATLRKQSDKEVIGYTPDYKPELKDFTLQDFQPVAADAYSLVAILYEMITGHNHTPLTSFFGFNPGFKKEELVDDLYKSKALRELIINTQKLDIDQAEQYLTQVIGEFFFEILDEHCFASLHQSLTVEKLVVLLGELLNFRVDFTQEPWSPTWEKSADQTALLSRLLTVLLLLSSLTVLRFSENQGEHRYQPTVRELEIESNAIPELFQGLSEVEGEIVRLMGREEVTISHKQGVTGTLIEVMPTFDDSAIEDSFLKVMLTEREVGVIALTMYSNHPQEGYLVQTNNFFTQLQSGQSTDITLELHLYPVGAIPDPELDTVYRIKLIAGINYDGTRWWEYVDFDRSSNDAVGFGFSLPANRNR